MRRPVLLAAILAALAGCGSDAAPTPFAAALPQAGELPIGYEDGCDCVTQRMCPIVDALPAATEVRNLSCRWIERGSLADCRFESRSDAVPLAPHEPDPPPGKWGPGGVLARLLDNGRWCAEDPRPRP